MTIPNKQSVDRKKNPQDSPKVLPGLDGSLRLARQVESLSCFVDRLQREHQLSATAAARFRESKEDS